MPTSAPVIVTRVTPDDWHRLRAIRLAGLADAPDMFGSTLAREQAFDDAEWRRRAARPASFVASREGVDVGTAGAFEIDGTWWLMGMWIAPTARGTGVVEALVAACESVARDGGAAAITLGVMADNPRGRAAYLRLGFAFTGERVRIREGRDELIMCKPL